jgi:hypothetical protein
MLDRAFSALASAWIVTFVATVVLFAALSAASIWDTAIYFKALQDALTMEHL